MPLAPGCRFGKYEIAQLIGSGGMGEVFRARDTRLGREVALKVLPERLRVDRGRLARFEREAQMLASLNHPNIGTLLEIETRDGEQALVLELVDGETLEQRIAEGPLPALEAIGIAQQIAAALEAAHESGIVHRDVKPGNVKLRADGTVKLLDFGLAEVAEPSTPTGAPDAATLSAPEPLPAAPGTPCYMSPEQVRGRALDQRSDIWAFGCVLFEMLTGRRAFSGATVSDTIVGVLQSEPDWSALPPDTAPSMRRLLRRCLEKDRKDRLRHIGDALMELREALVHSSARWLGEERQPPPSADRGIGLALLAAAAGAIAAVGAAELLHTPARTSVAVARFEIVPSPRLPLLARPYANDIAISPEGTRVAYGSAGASLVVRALEELEPLHIRELGTDARAPAFSPDGRLIAFLDGDTLRVVPAHGGPAETWAKIDGALAPAWAEDDSIVVASGVGLVQVRRGSEPALLAEPDSAKGERAFGTPTFLAERQALLFTVRPTRPDAPPRIAALDLDSGVRKELLYDGAQPRYLPTGHLVYAQGSKLKAVAFDPERLEVLSTPVIVERDLAVDSDGGVSFAIADGGTLAYVTAETSAGTAASAGGSPRLVVVLNWLEELKTMRAAAR